MTDVRGDGAGPERARPGDAPPIIAVVGATGTGKSELALDIAGELDRRGMRAEVVGADASQLYRGMDIGTAKLPIAERRGVPHRMIDVLDVTEEASVAEYQARARAEVEEVLAGGGVPILAGGSGLYVEAVLYELSFPGTDPAVRAELEAELKTGGVGALADRLAAVDPAAAARIGRSNARRIVRALEVAALTGQPLSGARAERRAWRPATIAGLRAERAALVARLDARVERMWDAGLVDEVAGLVDAGIERGRTAGRSIGYAQALGQLHGRLSAEEAIAETQALTRRYARRQASWFRRDEAIRWAESGDPAAAAAATEAWERRAGA